MPVEIQKKSSIFSHPPTQGTNVFILLQNMTCILRVARWNAQSLKSNEHRNLLGHHAIEEKFDFVCVQESRLPTGKTELSANLTLLCSGEKEYSGNFRVGVLQ